MEPKVPKRSYKPKFKQKPLALSAQEFVPEERKLTEERKCTTQKHRKLRVPADASEQCRELTDKLINRDLDCSICMHLIGWRGKIWVCGQCRVPTHLTCIVIWKNNSAFNWSCPTCNQSYSNQPVYLCYCGKVEEPSYSPLLLPHSCGESCGKHRGSCCPHLCPTLCHPGACPPCTAMAPPLKCPCGQLTYQTMCKDRENIRLCGNTCGAILNCGEHSCQRDCHLDNCGHCELYTERLCHCGQQLLTVKCGEESLSCGKHCGKELQCRNHSCTGNCHEGPCPQCEWGPERVKTCPCGRNSIESLLGVPRESCAESVPMCSLPCNKMLNCSHLCTEPCHLPPCPPCELLINRNCRCGATVSTITCNNKTCEVLCNKNCGTKKTCNKHKCEEECCPGKGIREHPTHNCTLTCGKTLNCGLHSCLQHCHIGNCELCKFVYRVPVYCGCGYSYQEPPIRCGTSEMSISCNRKCGKSLCCVHKCQSLCHKDDCPPCSKLVEKLCFCGKTYKPVQCRVQYVSCGKMCMKPRSCGHTCKYNCHTENCEDLPCQVVCARKSHDCGHGCIMKCHSGECMKGPCQVETQVYCVCKAQLKMAKCSEKTELKCTEECEKILRVKSLGEAFDSAKEEYDVELIEYARNNKQFLMKLEGKLCAVVSNGQKLTFLPNMNAEQRWFTHELISKHYNLESQSVDQEPYRSIVVYFKEDAKVPSPLISQFLMLVDRGEVEEHKQKEIQASLLFYQLTFSETTQDILDFFSKFAGECHLQWVNDHSAQLRFYSLHRCVEAKKYAERVPGPFSIVKLEKYAAIEDPVSYVKKFKNSKRRAQEVTEFTEEGKVDS